MMVTIKFKRDLIKINGDPFSSPTWLNGGFIGHIINVARVEEKDPCVFFYDKNDVLIAGFGSYIEHDFKPAKMFQEDAIVAMLHSGVVKIQEEIESYTLDEQLMDTLRDNPQYCHKCGEPLTSDDYKLRDAGRTGLHLTCLDEANEELQYRESRERIREDER